MQPTVSVADVLAQLRSDAPPLLFDCRYDLADPHDGRLRYQRGHLPGARYVHLDDELCARVGTHGGRHPLPSVDAMAMLFSRLGIERGVTPVVAYDDEGGCFAARLWWMLRYCGHEHVRVLDGGYAAWIRTDGEVTTAQPETGSVVFRPAVQPQLLADMQQVRQLEDGLLVDCRAHERFTGETEPIDRVAGRIPGAINVPWQDMVREYGSFVGLAAVGEALAGVDERSILYCGSGVTACVNVLAAERAGLGMPRLYCGSWSDWITWPDNPVATGE